MKIRKFTPEDAEGISEVVCRAERITLKGYYPDELIEHYCKERSPDKIIEKSRSRDFYVAEDEGRIIGVASLEDDWVRTVFVDPEYQGKGIGKSLIETAERQARENRVEVLHVVSTTLAEPFYQKCGFTTKSKKYEDIFGHRVLSIRMEKRLNE